MRAYAFQSTPLIRGETTLSAYCVDVAPISIHSPHTRGDASDRCTSFFYANFNPLPSYEGRHGRVEHARKECHFNPLPSCEGRPHKIAVRRTTPDFNPLPSYEGRRRKRSHERWLDQQFQSTPLMRGETARWRQVPWTYCHFNPLPSYEGRPYPELVNVNNVDFNPLPSCEGRRQSNRKLNSKR